MGIWQMYLALFAAMVWMVSGHLPRARRWIELACASFVLSTAYSRLGLPYSHIFTLCCDACLCLVVYCCGRQKWEDAVFNAFRFSLLMSLIYHFSGPLRQIGLPLAAMDHWAYVVGLELCNWVALLVIFDAAVGEGVRRGLASKRSRHLLGHHHSFAWLAARRKPPFFRSHR